MSAKCRVSHHQATRLKFRQDIFFPNANSNTIWLSEICERARKECTIFHDVQYSKYLFSECFTMFFEKVRNARYTVDSCFLWTDKSEIASSIGKIRDHIIESIIMEFEKALFFGYHGTNIFLRCYLDEVVDIHSDAPRRRETASRIVRLVDQSHFFELFHIVSYCCWRNSHLFISYEWFTSCRISTSNIFSDDKSENLYFTSIDGGFARHSVEKSSPRFWSEIFQWDQMNKRGCLLSSKCSSQYC